MKIGFILDQTCCVSGASNGIRMQALIWKQALEEKGHEVVQIQAWGTYEWKTFDVIHLYGFGGSIDFVYELYRRGCKIVISPIIDTIQNPKAYRLSTFWGCNRLRLSSPTFRLRQVKDKISTFLARSEYEANFIRTAYDLGDDKVKIVPLSYRSECKDIDYSKKEDFCFHCSLITQGRKNVMRLIQAAIKYNFRLILAGSTNPQSAFEPFEKLIDAHDNIECLGFVSDEQLEDLYTRAKVFALPSLNEGVGLVALEAAMHGCGIVITNIGGPQEYYGDNCEYAYTADPLSVDKIGQAVVNAMDDPKQPALADYIKTTYNLDKCIDELIEIYKSI